MNEIIERLEKATGPDRELDGEIFRLIDERPGDRWELFNGVWYHECREEAGAYISPPFYTMSIDAALMLVPRGWAWQVSNRALSPHTGRAYLNNNRPINVGRGGLTPNPAYRRYECTASTPTIALCITALKAVDSIRNIDRAA